MCHLTRKQRTTISIWRLLIWVSPVLLFGACSVATGNNSTSAANDAPIRESADAFVKAFNAGDAKTIAALWTPDGTMVDEQGQLFKGRQAIENEYAALFKAQSGAKIDVKIQSIDFPAPGVAVEDGVAVLLTSASSPAGASRYTAVHALQDGHWLMASVRESRMDMLAGDKQLQDLQWVIGKWEAKIDDVVAESDFHWIANKSFIQRNYTVHNKGSLTSSGMQIIGWDPQYGRLRSWSFDSSGGHGVGLWTPTPDGQQIESLGVLADGTPTSSTDLVIRVPGENSLFGWRSTERRAGDATLPDTKEVVMERVKEKQK